MYITLASLIDSMVLAMALDHPWEITILHCKWAFPSGSVGRQPASSQEATTGWIPDMLGDPLGREAMGSGGTGSDNLGTYEEPFTSTLKS
ncbi:hypothetical protein DSO57_1026619 [Entomophthora muscae]|uniref:Uncharacterized protein n=1 Tax=Entomophthora muscae TaxID=34485 RepID=A0ACC2SEX4_9FUNG|nr:hypothetical protein DSO57_1026619 [Entomophthora muscae]